MAAPLEKPEKFAILILLWKTWAEVAELVDAHDSKSCEETHEGSIPSFGTNKRPMRVGFYLFTNTQNHILGNFTKIHRGGVFGI